MRSQTLPQPHHKGHSVTQEGQSAPDEIERGLEATLFAAEEPLTLKICRAFGWAGKIAGARRAQCLMAHYDKRGVRWSNAASVGILKPRPTCASFAARKRAGAPAQQGRDRGVGDHRLSRTG